MKKEDTKISYHSLQAFTPLSKQQFDSLVQAVNDYYSQPYESDEPWEDVPGYEPDPYWQWNKDKKHYHVEDYEQGIEATAYHGKHGYFIEFIIHFDRLLYGANSHQLPAPDDLKRAKDRFVEGVFVLAWLDEILQLPSYDNDPTGHKSFEILDHFYDHLIIQRIDPAINIPNLSIEEMTLYSRVLNSGRWNNEKRQHFNTIEKPGEPHPKTFVNSCALETRVKGKGGKLVTSVRMNCYNKEAALLDNLNNPKKKHKPTNSQIDNAKGIYRLEVQVWQPYIETLRDSHLIESRSIADVLTQEFARMILTYYIHQFAGDGDYYRLSTAKRMISASKKKVPSLDMRRKLCTFLELLHNTYKSNEDMLPLNEAFAVVAKQMSVTMDTIKKYRETLLELNINPVTLPDTSSIKCLKNPLFYVLDTFPSSAEQGEALTSESPAELHEESRSYRDIDDLDGDELPF